jgi:hypothetical protein
VWCLQYRRLENAHRNPGDSARKEPSPAALHVLERVTGPLPPDSEDSYIVLSPRRRMLLKAATVTVAGAMCFALVAVNTGLTDEETGAPKVLPDPVHRNVIGAYRALVRYCGFIGAYGDELASSPRDQQLLAQLRRLKHRRNETRSVIGSAWLDHGDNALAAVGEGGSLLRMEEVALAEIAIDEECLPPPEVRLGR